MAGEVPSLPRPKPESPPEYPDLYGKRRQLAKVQVLEREISYLEEELKSTEDIQPASRSCKEIADFVTCNADPLIPTSKKIHPPCIFWKWLCGASCVDVSWIYCCSLRPNIGKPCSGTCCRNSQCYNKASCSGHSSVPKCSSCITCSCKRCTCNLNCPEVYMCSCCNQSCCHSCCFCY